MDWKVWVKTVVACLMVLLHNLPAVTEENLENVYHFPFLLAELQIDNPQHIKQNDIQETVTYIRFNYGGKHECNINHRIVKFHRGAVVWLHAFLISTADGSDWFVSSWGQIYSCDKTARFLYETRLEPRQIRTC
jgi:hypothetical protein